MLATKAALLGVLKRMGNTWRSLVNYIFDINNVIKSDINND